MNQIDIQEFNYLEKLLNEKVISPIDFWQRIRELKSIQTGELNKIKNKLFALEAKPFTSNLVPPIQTSYNDPATHTHYIEPRTTGEIMLYKLGYRESVEEYDLMIMGIFPSKNKREFERMTAGKIDYIEFTKTNGETSFTSYLTRKTHAPYKNNDEPKPVTKKELEAIIQIITEWMD
ncbi:MAG TPA: hypothetical protein VJZ51_01205 [Bacilli bacterium]|nr:hypothetical protein [Bacilli bacterium]